MNSILIHWAFSIKKLRILLFSHRILFYRVCSFVQSEWVSVCIIRDYYGCESVQYLTSQKSKSNQNVSWTDHLSILTTEKYTKNFCLYKTLTATATKEEEDDEENANLFWVPTFNGIGFGGGAQFAACKSMYM